MRILTSLPFLACLRSHARSYVPSGITGGLSSGDAMLVRYPRRGFLQGAARLVERLFGLL